MLIRCNQSVGNKVILPCGLNRLFEVQCQGIVFSLSLVCMNCDLLPSMEINANVLFFIPITHHVNLRVFGYSRLKPDWMSKSRELKTVLVGVSARNALTYCANIICKSRLLVTWQPIFSVDS